MNQSFDKLFCPRICSQMQLTLHNLHTGCKRRIRNIFEFKIWKKPLLVYYTSEESPNIQLQNDNLKMGVALSWGQNFFTHMPT